MNETNNDNVDGNNSTKAEDPRPPIPESTAYWNKEPYAWSTSLGYTPPLLTSSVCSEALFRLFHNTYYFNTGDVYPDVPNFLLSVVVESSSNPAGLTALYAQPWVYAGPGLGNIDECPLQTCLAGGRETDSITFASICMVPECSAYDVAADDFVSVMARQLDYAIDTAAPPQETIELGNDYIRTMQRIADVNKFLKTGWTCGNFIVPWQSWPWGVPYVVSLIIMIIFAFIGTYRRCQRNNNDNTVRQIEEMSTVSADSASTETGALLPTSQNPSSENLLEFQTTNALEAPTTLVSKSPSPKILGSTYAQQQYSVASAFWSAFDLKQHLTMLISSSEQHRDTACLDGLRVGSIFWIMLGHVMAIQSSSGAGYANPSNFLPPSGLTTTFIGQLLFSSRLAVDTFLTISGFLVVYAINHKLPLSSYTTNDNNARRRNFFDVVVLRYFKTIPTLLLTRMARILPLYAACLGFYTQIAPHLGSGPFWHQWIGLLKPCHDAIWTNFFFVNNFLPFNTPTTNTCFYHSWYLAVDMQLFIFAPFLVFWYQANPIMGKMATMILILASVVLTAYLSYERNWSVNTFDGAAVDRYDMEAYAKPHIRAQAYLAGMLIAMLLLTKKHRFQEEYSSSGPSSYSMSWRSTYTWLHRVIMTLALLAMSAVTFYTVTGAYARRPCTYRESPLTDDCGSLWHPTKTFIYTAFSRTIWTAGVAILIYFSIGRGRGSGSVVSSLLSWRCWTPLSHLSFGVYLIHPIVIFVWQLGDREKSVFRLLSFGMDYLSICLVSYVAALLVALVIEFPCAALWKNIQKRQVINTPRIKSKLLLGGSNPATNFLSLHPNYYGSVN